MDRKTKIVLTGTGFECKSSCDWCGTNKCKSYKAWWSEKVKENIRWSKY